MSKLHWTVRAVILALLAFVIFGPIANMLIWAFTEIWYFPAKLPQEWGFKFWERVFRPQGNSVEALGNSIIIALLTVCASMAIAVPAGLALGRGKLPWRPVLLLLFLLPQAFPAIAVQMNIARIFYSLGLNGTFTGVVMVHTIQGIVFSVWIATAAFSAIDPEMEEAAANLGASGLTTFRTITLPLAFPGIMASAVFVFLISLDEFTGTFFVGIPDITTLPILLYNAAKEGNYQIASITALIILIPSVLFMLIIERFLRADMLAKFGQ
nr:ABC transporter permease [uncultured Cohaesibacter sp.]